MVKNLTPAEEASDALPLFTRGIQTRNQKKESEIENLRKLLADLETIILNEDGLNIESKIMLQQVLCGCINGCLRTLSREICVDQNYFTANMTIVNKHFNQLMQDQAEHPDEFQQSSLVPPAQSGSAIEKGKAPLHEPNQTSADPGKNEVVSLDNLNGYHDFQKAIKTLRGEQVEGKGGDKDPNEEEQIPQQTDNAFDQLDPLFAAALNPPSV